VFIRGIGVDIPHPYTEGNRKDPDAHQVRLPKDWQAYAEQLQGSLDESEEIEISISSTATRGSVAIAIGHKEVVEFASNALDKRDAFGFIVGLSTLRELRAALDVAIASAE
jgi:hypothetical protein